VISRAGFPTSLFVEVTSRCNLRCAHCYVDAGPGGRDTDIDRLLAFVRNTVRRFGAPRFVSLTGGEPTLHPRFDELLAGLRDLGLAVGLSTNGVAPLARRVLGRHGPWLSAVQVSLDGPEPYHDQIRGPGTFRRVAETIALLEENSVPYQVQTTVGRDSLQGLPSLFAYLGNLHYLRRVSLTPVLPLGRGKTDLHRQLGPDGLAALRRLTLLSGVAGFAVDSEAATAQQVDGLLGDLRRRETRALMWWVDAAGRLLPWPSAPASLAVADIDGRAADRLESCLDGKSARTAAGLVRGGLEAALAAVRRDGVVDPSRFIVASLRREEVPACP
jgi:MoaA/NifB/PqqE/SkfB family radical SAM enzyme